jgi:PIN domain nuclease of toxin-antitoxin system
MIVLDASALLAFMFREAGHELVGEAIDASCMSTVNLSEVLARFARDGHAVAGIRSALERSHIEFVDFSRAHASISAEISPVCRKAGLSLADRACLALAIDRGLPVLTADRVWLEVPLAVRVRTIR